MMRHVETARPMVLAALCLLLTGIPAALAQELPVTPSQTNPVIVLNCGRELTRKPGEIPYLIDALGKAEKGDGAQSVSMQKHETLIRHQGFGEWGGAFQYELGAPAGYYTFYARYMSGGEVSQVKQTFTVLAGRDERSLGVRGVFQTVNQTPFKPQWLAGKGAVVLFPGDRFIRIVNTGKAHDVKVFSAFVMAMEKPMPSWISAEGGRLRSAFIASIKPVEAPARWLYLVDGDGTGDKVLFAALSQAAAGLEKTQVVYLVGPDADAMSESLNLPGRPAAVVVDADRKVVGVLHNPADVAQVSRFLGDPAGAGMVPAYPAVTPSQAAPPVNGFPARWLVASGWPGQSAADTWGVDADTFLRPNPGDLFGYGYYTAGHRSGRWAEREVSDKGICYLVEKLPESYNWGKGVSYAALYLRAEHDTAAILHLQHSGVASALYLDGVTQPLGDDTLAASSTLPRQQTRAGEVVQRAGNEIHDDAFVPVTAQPPLAARLKFTAGWHCLVIKLVHAQGKDESVLFLARLTDADGKALAGAETQTSDPAANLSIAKAAASLWPLLSLEGVPANLPRPGEDLSLVADIRVVPSFMTKWCPSVFLPFAATLRVHMSDYSGHQIGVFERKAVFPAVVKLDLGKAPQPGFYSLSAELLSDDGRLIHRYPPDGFSVVGGNAAQKERLARKELWNSWYYAFNDWETFAPWLERMGLFQNMGSIPGVSKTAPQRWQDAQARGLVLAADFAGDSAWMNNSEKDAQAVVDLTPQYTRWFKTVNEIDGKCEPGWVAARNPDKWVERARWQYQAVHKARADAIYLGGSLYCSGRSRQFPPPILSPRQWFRQCLERGLDQYIDAWDVHAYPQFPPRLAAPSVANGPQETDLGVLDVYKELGRSNTKPFFLGECGALSWHGDTGVRWQADTVSKLAAWTNSRPDWLGVAFCAAHHNRRLTAEDYGMAHMPGEAALYTASALIDGFDYKPVSTEDQQIQAAWFGDTFMAWRVDGKSARWSLPLDGSKQWLIVDVVGSAKPLEVRGGKAHLTLTTSPVYVLTQADYQRLTRLQ